MLSQTTLTLATSCWEVADEITLSFISPSSFLFRSSKLEMIADTADTADVSSFPKELTGSVFSSSFNVLIIDFIIFCPSQLSADFSRINHPCYPLGYNITKHGDDIFGSECTKHITPPYYTTEKTFTFFGQSDPAKCKSLVKRIFDLKSCEKKNNCSFNGIYQPPVTGDFMVGNLN